MSTIANLLTKGRLKPVNLGLLDDELPERGLLGTSRLFDFLEHELPGVASQDVSLSALEQVANLFGRYLRDRPLVLSSPISPIRHLERAIWELKTLDVRVFGWFASKDTMIIDAGCDVKLLKSGKLNYSGFINQTEYVRKTLGFAPADYIQGTQPHDILTNYTLLPRPDRGALRRRR
jgi:hypothetical protein